MLDLSGAAFVEAATRFSSQALSKGRSNSAIAEHLVVSERAVEKHISNIFTKLDLPPSDSDHRRVLAGYRLPEP